MASDKTASTSTAQIQADTFTESAVQYVRITVTGLSSGSWASFFEFKIFGAAAPQAAAPLSDNEISIDVPESETPQTLSRTGMSATATSFELVDPASNVLDGSDTTIWQTKLDLSESLPQSITIDLNGIYTVTKLRCLPKQDINNGRITSYNVYVSLDGINFGSAVATGTWELDGTEKLASFTGVSASYIKLEAVAGSDGLASAAEINVEGY
jgi:hypothetical protein